MKIREALLSEANELSELALHSKATWNYSEEFILALGRFNNYGRVHKNNLYMF